MNIAVVFEIIAVVFEIIAVVFVIVLVVVVIVLVLHEIVSVYSSMKSPRVRPSVTFSSSCLKSLVQFFFSSSSCICACGNWVCTSKICDKNVLPPATAPPTQSKLHQDHHPHRHGKHHDKQRNRD